MGEIHEAPDLGDLPDISNRALAIMVLFAALLVLVSFLAVMNAADSVCPAPVAPRPALQKYIDAHRVVA